MNLTVGNFLRENRVIIFDSLNTLLTSIKISPKEGVIAPGSNDLIISVGDRKSGLLMEDAEIRDYVYHLSKPLCYSETAYGEFYQGIKVIDNEIKSYAYVDWTTDDGSYIEEVEPLDIMLFDGYSNIYTNYQNVDIEVVYPKNDDISKAFLSTGIYMNHTKQNNEVSLDDIYFKDAFTKVGNELNEEIDNLNVKCITSKNNKFSLDSEGNLVVNTITANQDNFGINNMDICNLIYPVGSIYLSVNNVNPNTLFGGSWTQLKDRFLLGAGSTYSNGSTGGEATHKLTINEMPTHTHTQYFDQNAGSEWGIVGKVKTKYAYGGSDRFIGNAGGDQAHNNMPPYLVVYMWKRIS